MTYHTIQTKLKFSDFELDYFTAQAKQSNSLFNSAIYEVRQQYFSSCPSGNGWFDASDHFRHNYKSRKVETNYYDLAASFKTNHHYIALGGQCAQQVLKSVSEAFTSYNVLLEKAFAGELHFWPKLPGYRKPGGLFSLSYMPSAVTFDDVTRMWKLPISRENARSLKELGQDIWIPGPPTITPDNLAEIRIFPRNNEFYAEFVYKADKHQTKLDPSKFIAIDPGLSNLLAVVSNVGRSFLIDGKRLKRWNHLYNKQIAQLKQGKPQDYWDEKLAAITEKRNRQMRDHRNKAARFIVNWCLNNEVGTVVFGWNEGIKQNSNMGKVGNQNFVSIPLAKLKNRVQELCNEYGIKFVETEESYTSQASFLDDDVLPVYGSEKPVNWKASGTRKRRMYKTGKGWWVNADLNGAANIARKVSKRLGLDLSGLCRGILTAPKRYDVLECMSGLYRKQSEGKALQPLS